MKKLLLPLLAIAAACVPTLRGQADAPTRERVRASYLLAFGRAATDDEVKYWAGQKPKSVADLVARHRDYLARDRGTREASIKRSYVDAFGRNPDAGELAHWSKGVDTYADLMRNHMNWLGSADSEREGVIKRSYQFALNRQPQAAEIKYWKGQGVMSYVMLVATHDDWKKKAGATAPKTSGAPTVASTSTFLASAVLSPAIALEARAAAGMVAAGGGNMVAAGGGNITVSLPANMVAAGGGNMVAAGGGNLVAAGGGN